MSHRLYILQPPETLSSHGTEVRGVGGGGWERRVIAPTRGMMASPNSLHRQILINRSYKAPSGNHTFPDKTGRALPYPEDRGPKIASGKAALNGQDGPYPVAKSKQMWVVVLLDTP